MKKPLKKSIVIITMPVNKYQFIIRSIFIKIKESWRFLKFLNLHLFIDVTRAPIETGQEKEVLDLPSSDSNRVDIQIIEGNIQSPEHYVGSPLTETPLCDVSTLCDKLNVDSSMKCNIMQYSWIYNWMYMNFKCCVNEIHVRVLLLCEHPLFINKFQSLNLLPV